MLSICFSDRYGKGEMRVFAAVDIDDTVLRGLTDLLRGMKGDCGVKWVDPANMHITLYFFGETDGETLVKAGEAVRDAAGEVGVCTVRIEGLGCFPPRGTPRVLWAGVTDDAGALTRVAEGIRDRVTARKLAVNKNDREFSPHLTLGRAKRTPRQETLASFRTSGLVRFGSFDVARVALYQSTLTREGPVYRRIDDYPLKDD